MKEEEWKQIIMNGIEYDYLISNHGRVFSLKRQKLLKPHKKDNGYLNTNLRNNGENHVFLIHRLVAIHFIPNDDEEKTEVNHIDENKENNHVENLEWCTREYNMKHGTIQQRITNSTRKTCAKRVKCVETGQEFDSINEASKFLGVHKSSLRACLKGKSKTCKNLHWEYI